MVVFGNQAINSDPLPSALIAGRDDCDGFFDVDVLLHIGSRPRGSIVGAFDGDLSGYKKPGIFPGWVSVNRANPLMDSLVLMSQSFALGKLC